MSLLSWFHWYRTGSSIIVRSWFVCAAVLFVTVIRSGLHYSYGEFLVELRDDFNGSSMTEGNWIGTLVMTTSMTLAPISVSFIRLFDERGYQWCILGGLLICSVSCLISSFCTAMHTLLFAYSILQGVGTSLTYMASSLILIDYFDKTHPYHVLGTSILYCGYPLGSVIFNPIYAELVSAYGWRVAFRIAAILILLVAGITFPIFVSRYSKDEYEQMKLSEARGSLLIPWEKLRRPEVILWFTVNLTTFLGFYMPVVNLPSYMRDKGYQGAVVSMAVTVLSFSEIIAYIGASLIGDYLKGRLIIVNLVSSLALAAIYFMWPSVDNAGWGMILSLSVGSGLFLGFAIVYTFAETVDITRLPQDQAWGYTNTCSGVGLLMGPLLTGGIYDLRQSHDDVFYVTGGIFLLQLTLYCCLVYFVHRRDQREQSLFDPTLGFDQAAGANAPPTSLYYTGNYTQLTGNDDDEDVGHRSSGSKHTKHGFGYDNNSEATMKNDLLAIQNPGYQYQQQSAALNTQYRNYGGADVSSTQQNNKPLMTFDGSLQSDTAGTNSNNNSNSKISHAGASRRKSLRQKRSNATATSGSGGSMSSSNPYSRNSLNAENNASGGNSVDSGTGSVNVSSTPLSVSQLPVLSPGRMYTIDYRLNDPKIRYDS